MVEIQEHNKECVLGRNGEAIEALAEMPSVETVKGELRARPERRGGARVSQPRRRATNCPEVAAELRAECPIVKD